jgi:hypothetical protein
VRCVEARPFPLHMLHILLDSTVVVRDLCFPLLIGTFVGVSRNFSFSGWDEPADALTLENSCEVGGWDWETDWETDID